MKSSEEVITDRRADEFSLLDLFYWTTLFALGIGTFGMVIGLYGTAWVALIHLVRAHWRTSRWVGWLVVLVVFFHLLLVLVPSIPAARGHAPRYSSLNDLKQLGLALHNHQDTRGHMPAPITRDDSGNPQHSWRTQLLPYIEEQTLHDLIDLDVPWNHPNNILGGSLLGHLEVQAYHSPRSPASESPEWNTHYFAIVGEETMWPEGESISLDDVPDGSANTIVFIEAYGRGVSWAEPRDLTIDDAVDLLCGKGEGTWIDPGFLYSIRYKGDGCYPRGVAFADGHVRMLYPIGDRTIARALLTRNGGEDMDLDRLYELEMRSDPKAVETIINWLNIFPTMLYVGLALWPLFKKTGGGDSRERVVS